MAKTTSTYDSSYKQDEAENYSTFLVLNIKKLQFVEVKCQCGYTSLIPAYENIKCEKCIEQLNR
jgi:hypothetical protein